MASPPPCPACASLSGRGKSCWRHDGSSRSKGEIYTFVITARGSSYPFPSGTRVHQTVGFPPIHTYQDAVEDVRKWARYLVQMTGEDLVIFLPSAPGVDPDGSTMVEPLP
jgi:hypothetical protein